MGSSAQWAYLFCLCLFLVICHAVLAAELLQFGIKSKYGKDESNDV